MRHETINAAPRRQWYCYCEIVLQARAHEHALYYSTMFYFTLVNVLLFLAATLREIRQNIGMIGGTTITRDVRLHSQL